MRSPFRRKLATGLAAMALVGGVVVADDGGVGDLPVEDARAERAGQLPFDLAVPARVVGIVVVVLETDSEPVTGGMQLRIEPADQDVPHDQGHHQRSHGESDGEHDDQHRAEAAADRSGHAQTARSVSRRRAARHQLAGLRR